MQVFGLALTWRRRARTPFGLRTFSVVERGPCFRQARRALLGARISPERTEFQTVCLMIGRGLIGDTKALTGLRLMRIQMGTAYQITGNSLQGPTQWILRASSRCGSRGIHSDGS